jgi:hypothetical protein
MSKSAKPKWILNDDWAVSTDTYNWVLYQRSGKSWRAIGYYPSPEMMLKSFHRKLTRKEPPQPTLEQHVEHCLKLTQAAADRFLSVLATYPLPALKARPATVTSMLKKETVNYAS